MKDLSPYITRDSEGRATGADFDSLIKDIVTESYNEDDEAALGITEEDVTVQHVAPYDGRTLEEVLNIIGRHVDRMKSYQLAETRALVNVRRDIQGLP